MSTTESWFLEGWSLGSAMPWRVLLSPMPFRVGRRHDLELPLSSSLVSKLHARIYENAQGRLTLEDLGSTNGTLVNLEPVSEPVVLAEGDLVYFADNEFRLIRATSDPSVSTVKSDMGDLRTLEKAHALFREMIEKGRFLSLFQPIVDPTGATVGFELLSRGEQEGLPAGPEELFALAEQLAIETKLVNELRTRGLDDAHRLPGAPMLFVNTHPRELDRADELLDGLRRALPLAPAGDLVLEIHEMAVTDFAAFRELREGLNELGIQLAFDDFGAGRARFLELAELSPQFVKFDRRLIHRLESASSKRLELIKGLVRTVSDMEIHTIVEGIETPEEAAICWDLGFDLAQGYFYGRPEPATEPEDPPPPRDAGS